MGKHIMGCCYLVGQKQFQCSIYCNCCVSVKKYMCICLDMSVVVGKWYIDQSKLVAFTLLIKGVSMLQVAELPTKNNLKCLTTVAMLGKYDPVKLPCYDTGPLVAERAGSATVHSNIGVSHPSNTWDL